MLALLISMLSYAMFVLFAGASAFRDASGNIGDLVNGTFVNCSGTLHCDYGLANSYTVRLFTFIVTIRAAVYLRLLAALLFSRT